jgi:hypothetical protein
MPNFHCYMFNVEGEILFGVNIAAETLDAASRRAFELLRTKNQNRPSSRMISTCEVWSGSNRLFPQRLDAMPTGGQIAESLAAAPRQQPLPCNFAQGSVMAVGHI